MEALKDGQDATLFKALVLMTLLVCSIILGYLSGPLSFDGGLNFGVVSSLLEGNGYARFYDGFIPYSVESNSIFILLGTLTTSAFGRSFFASQLPNIIFATLVLYLLYLFLRRNGNSWLALAVCLAITATPGFKVFGFQGYGELPTLTFILLAFFASAKAATDQRATFFFLSGVLAGLAVSVKVIALVSLPIVVASPLFFSRMKFWKSCMASFLTICGVVLVYGAWELSRLYSLGYLKWIAYWEHRLTEIGYRTAGGSTQVDLGTLLEKGTLHVEKLAEFYGAPSLVAVEILALFSAYYLILLSRALITRFKSDKPERFENNVTLLLGALAMGYLIWWLFLTPTEQAWLRRILIGLIATQSFVAYTLVQFLSPRLGYRGNALVFCILVVGVSFFWVNDYDRSAIFQESLAKSTRSQVDQLNSLPENARIFGIGWYSAPQIAFYSDRKFYDLARTPLSSIEFGNSYVVLEQNALRLGLWSENPNQPSRAKIIDIFDAQPLFNKFPFGVILRLDGIQSLVPGDYDLISESISEKNFEKMAAARLVRGAQRVGKSIHASTLLDGWLTTDDPQTFILEGATYPKWMYGNKITGEEPIDRASLLIEVDGCQPQTASIEVPSVFTLRVPINCEQRPDDPVRHFSISTDLVARYTGQFGPRALYQQSYYFKSVQTE